MQKKPKSMLDLMNMLIAAEKYPITRAEFARIRREGTPEEIEEAVERMMNAGGYENLV